MTNTKMQKRTFGNGTHGTHGGHGQNGNQGWFAGYMDASADYQRAYNTRRELRLLINILRCYRKKFANDAPVAVIEEIRALWAFYRQSQHAACRQYHMLMGAVWDKSWPQAEKGINLPRP